MTRKDYVTIAHAIKNAMDVTHYSSDPTPQAGIADTARKIADALASDNGKFDQTRFLNACGVMS
jgi:hypothetical protein